MIDRQVFFNAIRPHFGGKLYHNQIKGMELMLDYWDKYMTAPEDSLFDLAYNFATAKWETGNRMQPVMEKGSRRYFDKYEPGTSRGRVLGNTQPGDGYRFRGAGHVQNTGRANARKISKLLMQKLGIHVNLEEHPEQRLDPKISILSLFLGNKFGVWTGKGLGDYIDDIPESEAEDLREFIKARYVVNGTDKAHTIAQSAMVFKNALYKASKDAPKKKKQPVQRNFLRFLLDMIAQFFKGQKR